MAKRTSTKKKRASRTPTPSGKGKELVIVESPAKAKTIKRYLGSEYVVMASVGHIRDLPKRAPKGSSQPIPGVDLDNGFQPSWETIPASRKVIAQLRKVAKEAEHVWFATDFDREGEAISWHLAEVLDIPWDEASRVVFNAITRGEIEQAFASPHPIDGHQVEAQHARRILDRIVGYQVSPLLWRFVAGGLSAGRVQSVAVRLVVEREDAIRAFVPDEKWSVTALLAFDPAEIEALVPAWAAFLDHVDERGRGRSQKARNAWLTDHGALKAQLWELEGTRFEIGCDADDPRDLSDEIARVAQCVGLVDVAVDSVEQPDGRGPAATARTVTGHLDPMARYAVDSVNTTRTTTKPRAPFITSTLQMAASSALGFGARRTMRTAQSLYEGVTIAGEGQVALITYMRTDSTHLSKEAIDEVRTYIRSSHGPDYLPKSPNRYASGSHAQEAHEAIRPNDVGRHPDSLPASMDRAQRDLYRLIWNRFVACQMTPALWDNTAVLLRRSDRDTGAVLRAPGRVLVFDGFYRASGLPPASDEQILPKIGKDQDMAPFAIDATQAFTSPPTRYSEASLVRKLEEEGIGRPSTYAAIIEVIQHRNYVEKVDRSFRPTDLGEVVTEKLIEAFPSLMDVGYTRQLEADLDRIAEGKQNWVAMLEAFYTPFCEALERAHDEMEHAKLRMDPAPYQCPECGARTVYRFSTKGRFLSCAEYAPDGCKYAATIDRSGRPVLPERVDMACPVDGSPMELRTGRFGPYLASINYPEVKFAINLDKEGRIKLPPVPGMPTDMPCEKCDAPLLLRHGKRGPWLGCSAYPKCRGRGSWSKLEDAQKEAMEEALAEHDRAHPPIDLHTLGGEAIPGGTPVGDLLLPGGVQELAIHPDAVEEPGDGSPPVADNSQKGDSTEKGV